MQGIFLDALERFVVRELGQTGLRRIREVTGRGDRGYVFDTTYPDEEINLIVLSVSQASGLPADEVLQRFAEGLVPSLLDVYGFLINPTWTLVDFLLNTEAVIHKAVRLNTPSAKPPAILAHRLGLNTVAITYRSHRRLCSVAKGIIRGAATHYQATAAISDERCMLRGDPECVITVAVKQ
ncbi:MAG: heme NO-binding domain-containing protein [Candidatus Dormibacteraceae bacterium]